MPQLNGIRIIDISRLLPGSYCTMLLADMGADVIKVESVILGDPMRVTPPFVDDESLSFASVNRNKRSLALNYRKPVGRQILDSLLATGDVLLEAFKPGQAARLGVDYARVREINPRIIYCSLSGYGQEGAYARRGGHDINFLALSGTLDLLRDPNGRPTLPGFQIADMAGGGLFAVVAILAALVERAQTDQGQYLDISIWEGTASLLSMQLAPVLAGVSRNQAPQGYLGGRLPGYNVYETRDGQYMVLGAFEPVLWAEFCKTVGREDLLAYQFPTDEDLEWVQAEVAKAFRERTRSEWEALLADKDLCCEPVLGMDEVEEHAVGWAIGQMLTLTRPGRPPLRTIASPRGLVLDSRDSKAPPQLGEHTMEILQELGYSGARMEELRAQRVIATPEDVTIKPYRGLPL